MQFFLENYPLHRKLRAMVKELNKLYKTTPALYEIEDSWDGFEWLAADDGDRNFLAYKRTDKQGREVIVLINFSGTDFQNYTLGVEKGVYRVVFNSDLIRFGGSGKVKKRVYKTEKTYSHGRENSIKFDLPKLTCVYLIKDQK